MEIGFVCCDSSSKRVALPHTKRWEGPHTCRTSNQQDLAQERSCPTDFCTKKESMESLESGKKGGKIKSPNGSNLVWVWEGKKQGNKEEKLNRGSAKFRLNPDGEVKRTVRYGIKNRPIPIHIGRYEPVSAGFGTRFCLRYRFRYRRQNISKISAISAEPISRPIFPKYRPRWYIMPKTLLFC